MEGDLGEMCSTYKAHILDGNELLQKLNEDSFSNIRGSHKLQRKVQKDILFLSEALEKNKFKKEHLVCTNLHFYKALVKEALNNPTTEAILETFAFKTPNNCQTRLNVDIVSCNCFTNKQQWTKVIARNPLALHQILKDGDGYGRRSIIDHAASYVQAASQNLHMYCSPEVVFSFVNGVTEELKVYLEKMGIVVRGNVITLETDMLSNSSSESSDEDDFSTVAYFNNPAFPIVQKKLTRLNLCVTTMIAYVSSLTNGGCYENFVEPLLNQQAEWEKIRPIKPLLDNLFEGKELICCSTAVEDFKNIIKMVGGEEESKRADNLLSRVEIVPDESYNGLTPSGKVKRRSLLIFGTGHVHKAITVTANKGFVHASKQKGVKFAVIIHESRALSERKQLQKSSASHLC